MNQHPKVYETKIELYNLFNNSTVQKIIKLLGNLITIIEHEVENYRYFVEMKLEEGYTNNIIINSDVGLFYLQYVEMIEDHLVLVVQNDSDDRHETTLKYSLTSDNDLQFVGSLRDKDILVFISIENINI